MIIAGQISLYNGFKAVPYEQYTFATLALQNGVNIKTVSSMLGHYNTGFTLRTYTHPTRQMQGQAAETMGNFMSQMT